MESLGWVLQHFLWQGAAVAIVLLVVLAALRRAFANVRYLASCGAILGMVLLPTVTYSLLPDRETTDQSQDIPRESSLPVSMAGSQVTTSDHAGIFGRQWFCRHVDRFRIRPDVPEPASVANPEPAA